MSDNTQNCQKCDAKLTETDQFCPKCGTPVGIQPKKKRSLGKLLLYGVAGVIGLFILLIILGAMLGPAPQTTSQRVTQVDSAPVVTTPVIQNTDVCYWDWQYTTTSSIGQYSTAPSGYHYAIVEIYLKNNADSTVSTNPFNWELTADGIKYTADSTTFSQEIGHQSVDVAKGGEMDTKIVYVVKGTPTEAVLRYKGYGAPDLVKIKHF